MEKMIDGQPAPMTDEDIAALAAIDVFPPASSVFTYKTDIWRRCTDEEAAVLDDALFNAPPRLRRLWDDCNRLEHDAPEWATLLDQATVAFPPGRAAIVFAPSSD